MDIDDQAILDFCSVTNASPEVAQQYLQVADGNVETAVTLFLESGGQTSTQPSTTTIDSSLSRSAAAAGGGSGNDSPSEGVGVSDEELARQLERQEREQSNVRAPIAPKHDILTGGGTMFDHGSLWGGREGPSATRHSIFNQGDSSSGSPGPEFLRHLTQPPVAAAAAAAAAGGSSSSSSSSPNGTSPMSAKAKRLADLFRPPFDIMFKGGFEAARATAREQTKWLMVNIQDPTEFTCQMLNRDLWSDETVKEFVRESFVFLQYACESPEGKRYLTYYPISKYPHVAIIDARTGERVHTWESVLTPTDFMMQVTEFLERHSPEAAESSVVKKQRMLKNISDMSEEEQINAAIAASLQAKGEDTQEEADKDQENQEEDIKEPQEKSPLDSIQPIKRDEPTDPANTTRIQLRTPDGKRIVRKFLKTDPVRYLFEFVKAELPESQDRPFELVFNRQQLIELLDQEIQEAGLANAAVNLSFHDS
ncbi:hypothetical protein O0I10_002381 [Lichtheimia ornata]|uniref:UBX domain-containing protein n=1 Tax=Lichtheimia ornata TaxID=688661 RepID=A0AAD7V9T6_9FUNG|nr:uncharacterized protein O0I10_002381 [Lichtheimia ornata]KAJ8662049.1 hypothetical protein O0I10_002381 [Lichtheimia ornata]